MRFHNLTVAVVNESNEVKRVIRNPNLPSLNGKPILPKGVKRLKNVKEVMKEKELSRNKASEFRRLSPAECLAS